MSKNSKNVTFADLPARERNNYVDSTFASRYMAEPIPKMQLPEQGVPAKLAYQVIKDLRSLDSRPNLNLASFVTTWMEPEARDLIVESLDVNFVNTAEYPSSTEISDRCIAMLASLFHCPSKDVGAQTIGSSEAIMLCGLAMKKRWAERRAAKGLDVGKPNLALSSAAHVCWEKFCRYWDVEPRYVLAEENRAGATPELLKKQIDENTIGVVAIFGSTYTGEYEDVEGIDAMVSALNKEHKWELVVHVDGASGAFVAPFIDPQRKFDFRLPNVASINVSGHKYGFVYPGIGWAIWRNSDYLPESMVFYADYLGTLERSITLNFSRGASHIIAQYYQFLRLGMDGYRNILANLMAIRTHVQKQIEKLQHFKILSKEQGIPLVAFRLKPKFKREYDEFDISDRLRVGGWVVPAYSMPRGAEQIKMMRITIREDLSLTMADKVVSDLGQAVEWLDKNFTGCRKPSKTLTIKT